MDDIISDVKPLSRIANIDKRFDDVMDDVIGYASASTDSGRERQ